VAYLLVITENASPQNTVAITGMTAEITATKEIVRIHQVNFMYVQSELKHGIALRVIVNIVSQKKAPPFLFCNNLE